MKHETKGGIKFRKAPHSPHVAYVNRKHSGLGKTRTEAVVALFIATLFGLTALH
jgi:hypothetical protein